MDPTGDRSSPAASTWLGRRHGVGGTCSTMLADPPRTPAASRGEGMDACDVQRPRTTPVRRWIARAKKPQRMLPPRRTKWPKHWLHEVTGTNGPSAGTRRGALQKSGAASLPRPGGSDTSPPARLYCADQTASSYPSGSMKWNRRPPGNANAGLVSVAPAASIRRCVSA